MTNQNVNGTETQSKSPQKTATGTGNKGPQNKTNNRKRNTPKKPASKNTGETAEQQVASQPKKSNGNSKNTNRSNNQSANKQSSASKAATQTNAKTHTNAKAKTNTNVKANTKSNANANAEAAVDNKPKRSGNNKRNTKRTPNKNKNNANSNGEKVLRIIPLGGLNEIGKNMTAVEYGDDIMVVDSGLAFPEEELLGIDVVIPDFTYLKKNANRVRGIVITHGHEDHIGGIPYVLKELDVPVYGTRLTLGLIENKLKEHKLSTKKLQVIEPRQHLRLGVFDVEPIRVCHSIPDAVAYAIGTPQGKIIFTGDFKIDYTPIDGQNIDLHRFAELGQEGVLALLADSTNVVREGYTMSESTVGDTFERLFSHVDSRIIVASFASNVHRLQQIVNAAHMNDRKVTFSGRSMVNVSNVAMELGYLKCPEDIIVDIRDIDRYPENEIVIVTTGSQGEPMSALTRMANSEHRQVEIHPGDLIIFSSSPIPGNEKSVYKVINQLTQKGANVVYESLADVHVSGHAKQEELKLIHSLVRPKYFLPVHGEFMHLNRHKELALDLGMNSRDIFIMSNGSGVEFSSEGAKFAKPVQAGRVFVDGLGVGDVGNIVLRDRKHLSEDGLIIVVVALSSESGQLVNGPDLISRGFVYVRESEALMDSAKSVIEKELTRCFDKNIRDWATLKSSVRDVLSQYIYQTTKRSPMILPIFMEV